MSDLHPSRPFIFAFSWILYYLLATTLGKMTAGLLPVPHFSLCILYSVLLLLLVYFLKKHSLFTKYRLQLPKKGIPLHNFLPLIFIAFIICLHPTNFSCTAWEATGLILQITLAAFCEELLFRGVVLNIIKGQSDNMAAVNSSVLFAIMHLLNLSSSPDLFLHFFHLLYCFAAGYLFCAITFFSDSLLPAFLAHVFINVIVSFQEPIPNYFISGIFIVLCLAYGTFLLKQSKSTSSNQ